VKGLKRDFIMTTKISKALYDGEIKFGNVSISCAVLDDGRRVLVQRSMANALGVRGSGSYWGKKRQRKGAHLPEYVSAKYLKPFISDDDLTKLTTTVVYINKKGEKAEALPAENLLEICDIWINADKKGAVKGKGVHAAQVSYIIMKGLAKVGIVALVDEATGYQDVRTKDALARLLEQYLAKEIQKWVKTFPNEYYKELFKLRGWKYDEQSTNRAPIVGKITNDLIYQRLEPNVLNELNKRNPRNENGHRRYKHHQWLTEDIGHPRLREHIASVITLMKISPDWKTFQTFINKALPHQIPLPLFDNTEDIQTK
jgi:hypothetical protein